MVESWCWRFTVVEIRPGSGIFDPGIEEEHLGRMS
jgi:hypothetical protein